MVVMTVKAEHLLCAAHDTGGGHPLLVSETRGGLVGSSEPALPQTAGCRRGLSSSVIRSDRQLPPSLLLVKILQCRQGSRSGKAVCSCLPMPCGAGADGALPSPGWTTAPGGQDVCVSLGPPLLALTPGPSDGHWTSSGPRGSLEVLLVLPDQAHPGQVSPSLPQIPHL